MDGNEPMDGGAGGGLPHVLVTDDNAMNRMVLMAMLEGRARITEAPDGAAGLAAIREADGSADPFDAALIDIRMPVMNGEAMMRACRAEEADTGRARLPMVCCSASVLPDEIEGHLAAGFDAHLAKPIMMPTLLELLDRMVATGRRARGADGLGAFGQDAAAQPGA